MKCFVKWKENKDGSWTGHTETMYRYSVEIWAYDNNGKPSLWSGWSDLGYLATNSAISLEKAKSEIEEYHKKWKGQ